MHFRSGFLVLLIHIVQLDAKLHFKRVPGSVLSTSGENSLGQGFYLPSKDILAEFADGEKIFASYPKECMKVVPNPDLKKNSVFFKSTDTFYKYLSTKTSISGKYQGSFTMGATLEATTNSISGGSLQISGLTLDIYALNDTMVFKKHCQNTLSFSKMFLADFQKLPVKIKDPNSENDWLPYDLFLKKYGSHIVQEINRGSRIQQWTFASSSKRYTERDFEVRACVDLSTKTGSIGVDACTNISSIEKKAVQKMTMSDTLQVKGGKAETRAKLNKDRTAELIEKFMVEATTSPGCRNDDDCHIGGAGSVCYCYGSSCVDTRKTKDSSRKIKEERYIRTGEKGSYDEGINNSCYYHVAVHCDCNTNWAKPLTVWPSKAELPHRMNLFKTHYKMKRKNRFPF